MAITLTQDFVRALSPNDGALFDGAELLKNGAYSSLGRTADGANIFAECKGSAKDPYTLYADLSGDTLHAKCSCPSRIRPCKHVLGLLLAWVQRSTSFVSVSLPAWAKGATPATPSGGAKGTKTKAPSKGKASDAEPAAETSAAAGDEGSTTTGAASEAGEKTAEKAAKKSAAQEKKKAEAEKKKTSGQLEALETLEQFLLDLVASGLGGLTARTIESIEEQARRMNDAQLPGAYASLMHLADLARRGTSGAASRPRGPGAGEPMSNEERLARIAGSATQLWVMIRKGKKGLEGKLEEGESQSEADAQLESILGRPWRLTELQQRGYWTRDRQLFELSHERSNDDVLKMADARGFFLDLGDGSIVQEITRLPFVALESSRGDAGTRLRAARDGVMVVKEAALYPGAVMNRRIRWDEKGDVAFEMPAEASHWARVHALAKPLKPLLEAFRDQLKNLLVPAHAVVLLQVARFGVAEGDILVAEDPTGARIAIRDPAETHYATTENLRHAASAFASGSLALRLFLHPVERVIYGQALSLIAGEERIRLGL